jgi:hypothetical protein
MKRHLLPLHAWRRMPSGGLFQLRVFLRRLSGDALFQCRHQVDDGRQPLSSVVLRWRFPLFLAVDELSHARLVFIVKLFRPERLDESLRELRREIDLLGLQPLGNISAVFLHLVDLVGIIDRVHDQAILIRPDNHGPFPLVHGRLRDRGQL